MRLLSALVVIVAACGGTAEPVKPSQPAPVVVEEPEEKVLTLAEKVAQFDEAKKDKVGLCRKEVGYDGPAETCTMELVGKKNAAIVKIITECKRDNCVVKGWLLRGEETPALPLPKAIDAAGNVETNAGISELVGERRVQESGELELRAYDLQTHKTKTLAACFAPRLSPGGKFFACRDRAGNLLRVSAKGGKPEVVAKSGVSPDRIEWDPANYLYPGPATFKSETEVSFEVPLTEGDPITKTASWKE